MTIHAIRPAMAATLSGLRQGSEIKAAHSSAMLRPTHLFAPVSTSGVAMANTR